MSTDLKVLREKMKCYRTRLGRKRAHVYSHSTLYFHSTLHTLMYWALNPSPVTFPLPYEILTGPHRTGGLNRSSVSSLPVRLYQESLVIGGTRVSHLQTNSFTRPLWYAIFLFLFWGGLKHHCENLFRITASEILEEMLLFFHHIRCSCVSSSPSPVICWSVKRNPCAEDHQRGSVLCALCRNAKSVVDGGGLCTYSRSSLLGWVPSRHAGAGEAPPPSRQTPGTVATPKFFVSLFVI